MDVHLSWEPSWEPFAVDAGGIEGLLFRPVWTAMDAHGRCLEIYGSEGWGFESLRACHTCPSARAEESGGRDADDSWGI